MEAKKRSAKEILEENLSRTVPKRMAEMKIMLHNVRSMHNVGAVFRSADAFGISELLLAGFTPTPPRPEISKTAIGAEKFVEWEQFEAPSLLFEQLKMDGYVTVGVEQTDRSTPLPDFEPPPGQKLCLVFGNEVTGIAEEIIPHIDAFVDIPQYGHKHSLNVSVAAGVTLYGFLQKFWDGD